MLRSAAQIRTEFIDFFVQRAAHTFVPSSPVVPHDDPTLLFTNAGMNQFKDVFLATGSRPYKRAVNTQKCIRAGGKHNDLEDVGKDTYHHTFFEMLGNWSFDDYFKAEAIQWAWELLTQIWNLDPGRLHATYFQGDPAENLEPDLEARDLWLRYLPKDRIHPGNKKDNFWEMGESGPCGPCSEIHYDGTPQKNGPTLVNHGDPRVIEIWNLVFIQFNRGSDGKLTPLPAKHVDTGMGFERIVRIIQNKQSNYDTDLWSPIFAAIESHTGAHPYRGKLDDPVDIAYRVVADHIRCLTVAITDGARPSNEGRGYVLRRILRRAVRHAHQTLNVKGPLLCNLVDAVVDSLSDVFPELTKNPKQVAQIIRDEEEGFLKTVDRGIELFRQSTLHAIADQLGRIRNWKHIGMGMADAKGIADGVDHTDPSQFDGFTFQDEHGKLQLVPFADAIKEFEEAATRAGNRFVVQDTDSGTGKADDYARRQRFERGLVKPGVSSSSYDMSGINWRQFPSELRPQIAAADAFKLHDTYGFPIDLTRVMAEERGMTVDVEGFERLMEQARQTSKGKSSDAATNAVGTIGLPPEAIARLKAQNIAPTDDIDKFHGRPIQAKIEAIWNGADFDEHTDESHQHDLWAIITDKTNFYAEAGGQIGDTGRITDVDGDRSEFIVQETKSFGPPGSGYVLHIGRLARGEMNVGETVQLQIPADRRSAIRANHTSTHLLNLALRGALGEDIHQRGSLVADDRLRFDFSSARAMTHQELAQVEQDVNSAITHQMQVYAEAVPLDKAKRIRGVRAVFGEKYPDPVRVVSIGVPIAQLLADAGNAKWMQHSIEFCGGTHLSSTDEARSFVIVSEQALAAGVRRIIALTGPPAMAADVAGHDLQQRATNAAKLADDLLPAEFDEIVKLSEELTLSTVRRHRIANLIDSLRNRVKSLRKTAQTATRSTVVDQARALVERAPAPGDGRIIVAQLTGADKDSLLAAMDVIKAKRPDAAAMLISANQVESKVFIVAAVPDTFIQIGLKAGDWVKQAALICGGSGGGRPDLAQAGGKDPAKLPEAINAARSFAQQKLGGA